MCSSRQPKTGRDFLFQICGVNYPKKNPQHYGDFYQLATDIMGAKIKTPEREDIGVVQNIMIDPQHSAIIYIILCYANFVGKMHRQFAIPRQMLRVK
jgi:ribosomal 30S subunit maturation factor RimM